MKSTAVNFADFDARHFGLPIGATLLIHGVDHEGGFVYWGYGRAYRCDVFALAQEPQLLAPSQLNKDLKGSTAAVLDDEFNKLVGRPRVASAVPLESRPGPVMVTDPYTHREVDASAVAHFALAVQQIYLERTHHNLTSNAIDLDVIASSVKTSVTNAAAPKPATVTVHGSGIASGVQVPREPMVGPQQPTGPASATCPTTDVHSAIAADWTAIQTYTATSTVTPCTDFAALLDKISATGPPPAAAFTFPDFTFGNKSTAYGDVHVAPALTANTDGSLVASLETKFSATVLNGQPLTLLDGSVKVTVPSKASGGKIATNVSVTGGAFSNATLYQATSSLGPSSGQYTGTKNKTFDFWTFSKSWVIPLAVGTTTVTATAGVNGNANLSYGWQADSFGMYATANPSVSASVHGSVGASNVLCSKCAVNGDLTIQDSDSHIDALLARVTYHNTSYVVERLYAAYKPPTYQATIEATGHLMMVFYFDQFLMKSPIKPLGSGVAFDSGWSAKPI